MKIDRSLLRKYGLKQRPNDQKVEEWIFVVNSLVSGGKNEDIAGEQAARQVFPDYNTLVYTAETESIQTLLAAARDRGQVQYGS